MLKVLISIFICSFGHAQQSEWDLKDTVISVKITKEANVNSEAALSKIEKKIKEQELTKQEAESYYALVGTTSPVSAQTDKSPEASLSLGKGIVDISVPLPNLLGLSDAAKIDMSSRLKYLRMLYESGSAGDGAKYLVEKYFNDYLGIDITASEEQLVDSLDGDLSELKIIFKYMKDGNKKLKETLLLEVDKLTKKTVSDLNTSIGASTKKVKEHITKESGNLKLFIDQANNPILDEIEDANETLDFLKMRELERELDDKILSSSNSDRIDELLQKAETCVSNDLFSECSLLKNPDRKAMLEDRKTLLITKDVVYATTSTLQLAQGVAILLKDPKTAQDISKAIYTVETLGKIADLASNLSSKATLAAFGDVMSMANLSISIINAFGSSGPSADEAILAELRAIRMAIQELREEMHERFDLLSSQVEQLGIGVNLKLEQTNENLLSLSDNQKLIIDLINTQSAQIANFIEIQANAEIGQILRTLGTNSENISGYNDAQKLSELFMSSTAEFVRYLEFTNDYQLGWTTPTFKNVSWKSPEVVSMVDRLSVQQPLKNYSNFSLVDFLIHKSAQENLGGDCSRLNFNNIYLFNLLSYELLPIFSNTYNKIPADGVALDKYTYFLMNTDIDAASFQSRLERPLALVENTVGSANLCLNNYASSDGGKINIISYLVKEFAYSFKKETQKVLSNASRGKHREALVRAIKDPNSGYLAELEGKVLAVNKDKLAYREMIDLNNVDLALSIEGQKTGTEEWFNKVFSEIPNCQAETGVYAEKLFSQQLRLPSSIISQLLNSNQLRFALKMGLNKVNICFQPASNLYNFGISELQSTGEKINGPSLVGLWLHVSSPENQSFFSAQLNYDLGLLAAEKNKLQEAALFTIPIFIPVNKLKFNKKTVSYYPHRPGDETSDDFKPGIPKAEDKLTYTTYVLDIDSYNNYLNTDFAIENWTCEASEEFKILPKGCYVDGFKSFAKYHDASVATQQVSLGQLNKKFIEQLNVANVEKSFEELRRDFLNCYRRTLLGYSDCRFSTYISLESVLNTVDYSDVNLLENILRTVVPALATFKKDVSVEEQKKFVLEFDKKISSPLRNILEVSAASKQQGDGFLVIEKEMEKAIEDINNFSSKTEALLEINTRRLLNTKSYEDLQYYNTKTRKVLGLDNQDL